VNLIVLEDAMSFPDGFYGKYIRARVIDTKGRILVNSIPPFGKKNWLTALFEKENVRIGRFSWGMKDNPYLSKEEILSLIEDTPEHLRASIIDGNTSAGDNGLFGDIRNKSIGGMQEYIEGHIYQGGLDIGKTFDRTVIAISDLTAGRLVYIEQFPPKFFDTELVEDKVLNILKKYRFPNTYVDLTSWGERYHQMVERHPFFIGFNIPNLKTRNLLIEDVVMAVNRNYTLPNFQPIIAEMENLEVIPRVGYYLYKPGYGHHDDCLKKGTLIRTKEGHKPIEDILPGEEVLTHMGRYKRVEKCLKKPFAGVFYNLSFGCQIDLSLSYNHPLLAASFDRRTGSHSRRKWVLPEAWCRTYRQVSVINKLNVNPENILSESMFYKNSKKTNGIKVREIIADAEFARFLGLFLAEGCCYRSKGVWYTMSLGLHRKEKKLIDFARDYLVSKNISVKMRIKGNSAVLVFSSKLLHCLMSECYDANREKIIPSFAFQIGRDLKYTLEYWLKGDGWKRKTKSGKFSIGATTSKRLALDMRDIAWSVGKYAVVREIKARHRYGVLSKPQFWVEVYEKRREFSNLRRLSAHEYGGRLSKTKGGIEKEYFEGEVYNLQVEDDRSFVANGIVVHNCIMATALSIHGWARKMYNSTLDLTPKEIEPDMESLIIKEGDEPDYDIGDALKVLDNDSTFLP
jgi:hypothetical protein